MDGQKVDVRSNLKAITNELTSTHLHGNLSKWTVKCILQKYVIRNYARRIKPFVSFQSRNARIRWANAVQDWRVPQWKDVMFSDEFRFGLKNDCKTLRVWRTKQEFNDPTLFLQTFKGSTSVMFFGCIGPNGDGVLLVCDTTINAEKYVCLLHDNLFARARVLSEWDLIPGDFIGKLYDSLPRRILAVKRKRGYPTKY